MQKPKPEIGVVVDPYTKWIPIDGNTPVGLRMQLINRARGTHTTGTYQPGSEWTHYRGLPTFADDEEPS